MPDPESHRSGNDYLAFLTSNRDFRRLWYGQVVSQLGDWFDQIAVMTLLFRFTGSGKAVGLMIAVYILPTVLLGPVAGVVVDRFRRRSVMIAADVIRAGLVVLLLFVRSPETVWIVYPALFLRSSLTAFFEPARNALVPSVVAREHLVVANTISSFTWSVVLAAGAAVGGLATQLLGPHATILLDALSFLFSAAFIMSVHAPDDRGAAAGTVNGLASLRGGFSFLATNPRVALLGSVKASWALAGGGSLLVLPIIGNEVFPIGRDGAVSIGLLYAARGIGTAMGPVAARWWGGQSVRFMRRCLVPSFLLGAAGYLLVGWASGPVAATLGVVLAHVGGSVAWVFSTVLLQIATPDAYRGRIFAAEIGAWAVVAMGSIAATALLHDSGWSGLRLCSLLGAVLLVPAVALWGPMSKPLSNLE